ncbi:D-alanine--poly(phosphoribitol) ligase subunit 1 [Striga asiatica]|uniref:D-alanine--poly(Phosphoribitol) ligase subunit 1 n=1 Tax=Striga asiatica TaxID=4170 RepID=A0A5A7R9T6_STRAF|nr:D-alanine--poly(phosphoribitol) ligase subunit 1 [Striga asiatica]
MSEHDSSVPSSSLEEGRDEHHFILSSQTPKHLRNQICHGRADPIFHRPEILRPPPYTTGTSKLLFSPEIKFGSLLFSLPPPSLDKVKTLTRFSSSSRKSPTKIRRVDWLGGVEGRDIAVSAVGLLGLILHRDEEIRGILRIRREFFFEFYKRIANVTQIM